MANFSDLLLQTDSGGNSLSDIFEEEPVSLDVFIADSKFMGMAEQPLSPVQYEAVRHIERIYFNGRDLGEPDPETGKREWVYNPEKDLYLKMGQEFDPYWAEPYAMKNLITLQWGKGSGKDHICRVSSLRIAYLLLCLKNPRRYFNMPSQDTIHLLNVASSSQQAVTAFFTPMTRVVKTSSWFKDKAEPKQFSISFDKNVEAISGHSDAEGLEGGNLLLGIADEIDGFKTQAELRSRNSKMTRESSRSAESILDMLQTSASTRFPLTYKRIAISYPRFKGSKIQQLTAQANDDIAKRGSVSPHYVSGPKKTWEVNPNVKGPEYYADDYARDPEMARAKYECNPSFAVDAFFKNSEAIKNAFQHVNGISDVEYVLEDQYSPVTKRTVSNWETKFQFDPDFKPIEGALYAIHGDLAINGDAAGVSMSHVSRYETVVDTLVDEHGTQYKSERRVAHVKTDFSITFDADISVARDIRISWVRDLIFKLISMNFAIAWVSYDGFQSVDSIQQLQAIGIEAEKLSMDRSDLPWRSMKDLLYEGRLTLPFNEKLMVELQALSRMNGKIDHPPGGSKDRADAVCGSIYGALEIGGEEDPTGRVAGPATNSISEGPALMFMTEGSVLDIPESFNPGMLRMSAPEELSESPWEVSESSWWQAEGSL